MDLITVTDAAQRLSMNARSVRDLLASGALEGEKTSAGDWLVSPRAVTRFQQSRARAGRPWKPLTSWSVISELAGLPVDADAVRRKRIRDRIAHHSADDLVRLCRSRTSVRYFTATAPTAVMSSLEPTGRSAAHRVSAALRNRTDVAEGYASPGHIDRIAQEFLLLPATAESGNVVIREKPDGVDDLVITSVINIAFDLATSAATRDRSTSRHVIEEARHRWLPRPE